MIAHAFENTRTESELRDTVHLHPRECVGTKASDLVESDRVERRERVEEVSTTSRSLIARNLEGSKFDVIEGEDFTGRNADCPVLENEADEIETDESRWQRAKRGFRRERKVDVVGSRHPG